MSLNNPSYDVFARVHADLRARDAIGWNQRGVMLDARYRNELAWLKEAYEEALDMAVYLKAAIIRREEHAEPSDPQPTQAHEVQAKVSGSDKGVPPKRRPVRVVVRGRPERR